MIEQHEALVTDEIRKLIPVLGKENGGRLLKAYLLADEDTKKRIFELVDVIKAAVYADPDLRNAALREPPAKKQPKEGDIQIGNCLYGRKRLWPFYLPKETFLTHFAIFGSSGYGKTNLAYSMIESLANQNIPVIIFDFSKRNYKDLLATPLRDRIDLYTVGRNSSPFRFNPLVPPPGIQLSQWMKEFASIFDHAYWLLGGGRHIILKTLDAVFLNNEQPVMQDLKTWLSDYAATSLPTRERNWISTAERPLASLCFKELGEVFNVKGGFDPATFFTPGKITILELDALDTNDKSFLIEILMQWIRDWLLVNWKKEELAGVLILEEAHHVLNREKSKKMGSETVMDLVFREVRELGLGIVYIDQHPSLVSYPALGNTSTHVYMNLGLDTRQSSDIEDAASLLGLDEEEKHYLRQLPVGHGFLLVRSSLQDAFLIEFPKFPLAKGSITDDDIEALMRGRLSPTREVPLPSAPVEAEPQAPSVPAMLAQPEEQELKIIEALGMLRGSFTSQIYQATKMSGKTFEKHISRLLSAGLVGTKQGKIGRNVLHFYFLTDKGDKIFDDHFTRPARAMERDVSDIISSLQESGWMFDSEGKKLIFSDANKKVVLFIMDTLDRDRIEAGVRESPYFICTTEAVRTAVLQVGARMAHKYGPLSLYLTSPEKFAKKADFERIDLR